MKDLTSVAISVAEVGVPESNSLKSRSSSERLMGSKTVAEPTNCMICPKLTMFLAGFMLLLLILYPLVLQSNISSTAVPYLIYSSFLTSVGVLIGISSIWLNSLPISQPSVLVTSTEAQVATEIEPSVEPKSLHLTKSERWVVEFLQSEDGECWQAELVRNSQMNSSKISRTLTKMESRGLIDRVRDGMGKRVILIQKEGF